MIRPGVLAVFVVILLTTPSVHAQGPLTPPGKQAEQAPTESDQERERARLNEQLTEWTAKASEYAAAWRDAPQRQQEIEREIAELEAREVMVDEESTSSELATQRIIAEQALSAARREASEIELETSRRVERRRKLPELLKAAKVRLQRLEQPAQEALPAADADALAAASKLSDLRRSVLKAEIDAYQNELGSYEARGLVLTKRRDRVTLEIKYYEALTAKLADAIKTRRREEVLAEAVEAQELLAKTAELPESIRELAAGIARENAAFAEEWTGKDGVVDKIEAVSRKLARAEERVAEVDLELENLQQKVEAVGLADTVGVLLRQRRADAPDVGKYRRFIRMRQDLIGTVQLQQIGLRERREEVADIDALVAQAMREIDPPVSPQEQARTEDVLRRLFEKQRRYLDSLIGDYEVYFERLVDFDARQQELIEHTERLTSFIDERVLWIPSGKVIDTDLFSNSVDALTWLTGGRYRAQLARAIGDVFANQLLWNLFVLLGVGVFVFFRRRIDERLDALADDARRANCTRFRITIEALVLTLLIVPWLPGLLGYMGWQLGRSPEATQFTRCVAYGMVAAAVYWVSLRLITVFVRRNGVAEAHCSWPDEATFELRRDVRWLTALGTVAVFLIFVFDMRGEDAWKESVGRVVFIVLMLATAAFTHVVLRRTGSLRASVREQAGMRLPPSLLRTMHAVGVAVPVILAIAAARGYYWTGLQLGIRQHLSLVFLFVVFASFSLINRWSRVTRRRVALEQRGQSQDEEVDLVAIKAQTSRLTLGTTLLLTAVGLIAIWADVMPAAGILKQVELWNTTETVSAMVADAKGIERQVVEDHIVAVTLADLLWAILIAVIAFALMRNLPGLLEVSLLRRFSAGERYAYATLVKYATVLIGLSLAFDAIGIGWNSIQWLVAAVGLGLGFGLQEIFANFMSGLIILFERPIRVGDIVTVGDVSGTVSRIQMRATWITGFDRKELVVPNRDFVTQRLINWSLSDAILRVEVPVGIAYGSDTDKAIAVLESVAQKNPAILHQPEPKVLFLGFGDSSLSFELRGFIARAEQVFEVRHQLHMAIDKAFREAGIEIAFPQRDLHVRTLPAELIRRTT